MKRNKLILLGMSTGWALAGRSSWTAICSILGPFPLKHLLLKLLMFGQKLPSRL